MSNNKDLEKLEKMEAELNELDKQIDEMLVKRGLKPMTRGHKAGTTSVTFIKKR